MSFTPLTTDEIEFRVQSISVKGYAIILPYKDARADMKRLDEVYGIDGWQKRYELIDNKMFCSVGIWSDKHSQWIWKQDVGTPSNTEAEKGEASDAFKRACFNLGIGRELYDYPLIMIKLNEGEFEVSNNKAKQTYGLKLKSWKWESEFAGSVLVYLRATDEKGNERFKFGFKTPEKKPTVQTPRLTEFHPNEAQIKRLQTLVSKATDPEATRAWIKSTYKVESTKDLTIDQYNKLTTALEEKINN
jgi:hypothetical protein